MRFGRDDYILFPQWYHPTYPYLAAIPKQPGRGETSPYAIMWYTAQPSDFTVTAGCADDKRPGYVHKRFEAELDGLRASLLEEVAGIDAELRQAQDATTTAGFLASASRCMRHAWMYLTTYAAAFEEKRLELAEFQRTWLELKGLANFYTWHRDRCDSVNDPVPREAERCVGCIVSNVPLAMMFHDMGVPVWLVREKFSVLMGDIHIGFPTDLAIKLGDHGEDVSLVRDPTFPEIYTQSPQHPLHYHVQHRFSRVRSVVISSTPAGTLTYKDIPVSSTHRRNTASILVSLQALRAQTSTGADNAAASSSTSISSAASSSSRPQKLSTKAARVHPCKSLPLLAPKHLLNSHQIPLPRNAKLAIHSRLICSSRRTGLTSRMPFRLGAELSPASVPHASMTECPHPRIITPSLSPKSSPPTMPAAVPVSSRLGSISAIFGLRRSVRGFPPTLSSPSKGRFGGTS